MGKPTRNTIEWNFGTQRLEWRTQSIMSKDVAMWQLKKDNHIVTFKLDDNDIFLGQVLEVGQGFVGENHLFASWPVNQARNLWATKIEEGYRRYP